MPTDASRCAPQGPHPAPSPQHPAVILCWTLWNFTLHCPLGIYLENQGTLCSFLGVLFYTLPLFSNMLCTSRSPRQPQIAHSISFIQQDLIFVGVLLWQAPQAESWGAAGANFLCFPAKDCNPAPPLPKAQKLQLAYLFRRLLVHVGA